MATWLDEKNAKAVAVLATAAVRQLGRNSPVVSRLQRLLRERTRDAYEQACVSFDMLTPDVRGRIAETAPTIARGRLRLKRSPQPTLSGLLGALNRR
jgi:hypothetical protein